MYTIRVHYVISCLFRFIELYVQYTRSLVQICTSVAIGRILIIQMQERHYAVHSWLRRRPRRRPRRPIWQVIAAITPIRRPRVADNEKL